jgi:hypothetical protein
MSDEVEKEDIPVYDRDNLPSIAPGGATWGDFTLREPLRAVRVEGAFECRLPLDHALRDTLGTLPCRDGWLALDQNGDPFPIEAAQFDAIYHFDAPSELTDEQIAAAVEERYGSWLNLDDIRTILKLIDGKGAIPDGLETLTKLRAIEAKGR